MKSNPKLLFITLLGIGNIPIASGTVASIIALATYYVGYLILGNNIRYLAIFMVFFLEFISDSKEEK